MYVHVCVNVCMYVCMYVCKNNNNDDDGREKDPRRQGTSKLSKSITAKNKSGNISHNQEKVYKITVHHTHLHLSPSNHPHQP